VYINNNGYLKGAPSYEREEENFMSEKDPKVRIVTEDGTTYLEMQVEKGLLELKKQILASEDLGMVRIVEAPFDDPQGKAIVFDTDYNDTLRTAESMIGPFAELKEGFNRIQVWG